MKKSYLLLTIVVIIIISAGVLRIKQIINNGNPSNYNKINNELAIADSNQTISDDEEISIEEKGLTDEDEFEDVPALGSNRDDNGCIASAGYAWCESKEKCLRIWEEDCPLEVEESHSRLAPIEVVLSYPLPGDTISSPLKVEGRALGKWFFEAVIPLRLVTEDGEEIVRHYGEAEADWMSDNFVPFSSTLEFTTEASSGYLIVERNNASGLAEHDAQISIPIKFN